ncbi:MAG: hypothetical protein N2C14_16500, partial [Planctomycetales bacterium]
SFSGAAYSADAKRLRREPPRSSRRVKSRQVGQLREVQETREDDPFADPFAIIPSPRPQTRSITPLPPEPELQLVPESLEPASPISPPIPPPPSVGPPIPPPPAFQQEDPAAVHSQHVNPNRRRDSRDAAVSIPTAPQLVQPPRGNEQLRAKNNLCADAAPPKGILDIEPSLGGDEGGIMPENCTVDANGHFVRCWRTTRFTWKSSSLCHNPLYFEDVQLERYGNTRHWLFQPAISGAKFVASIVTLPYQAGLAPPRECVYTLGYYRPGSCAPHLRYRVPLNLRAGLLQAGVVTGLVLLIP